MSEQRRYPRANAILPVTILVRETGTDAATEGQATDLGFDGIGLILRNRLPSTLQTGTLRLGASSSKSPIDIDVRVVWLAPTQDGQFRCGVQFISVNDAQLAAVRELFWSKIDSLIEGGIRHILEAAPIESRQPIQTLFFQNVKGYLKELVGMAGRSAGPTGGGGARQRDTDVLSNDLLVKADQLGRRLGDKLLVIEVKKAFRLILGPWIYQARLMRWGYEKPQGYPGDYGLLEVIYDNRPREAQDSLAGLLDGYFLRNAYAESVRCRKDAMRAMLRGWLQSHKGPSRVLNIASGACREIRELLVEDPACAAKLVLTALDQDRQALDYGAAQLVGANSGFQLCLVQEDILHLIKDPAHHAKRLGPQELVYSIGLADYLPDRVLKKLIGFCMDVLAPGGRFVLAHKDQDRDPMAAVPPDWFCDWHFYHRTEQDVVRLVQEAGQARIHVERDSSDRIFFVIADKAV